MYELKLLTREAVPDALKMAERYRLLNEPVEAESICQDILSVDANNQEALITLLLALTDQFDSHMNQTYHRAQEVLERLGDRFCQAYYQGIIFERRAKVYIRRDEPGSGPMAHEWLVKAMAAYNEALTHCSPGNQDAILRWNTCARIINGTPHVKPTDDDRSPEMLDSYE